MRLEEFPEEMMMSGKFWGKSHRKRGEIPDD